MGLFCGLRKGENYGLKFSDFDIESKSVKISRQIVVNPIIRKGSKIEKCNLIERDSETANSFRTLRVPDIILEELDKRRILIRMNKDRMKDNFVDKDYICCQ